jgi:hypothetical protein
METRRGRPVRSGILRWRNHQAIKSTVFSILDKRDIHNETTLTDTIYAVEALAKQTIPAESLTDRRLKCLRKLAIRARPSRISRTIVSWRDNLPDRIVRRIQRRKDLEHIAELWWA